MPNYTLKIIVEGEDRASGPLKNVGSALGDIGKIAAGVGLGNLLSQGVGALAGMAKGALDSYAAYERLGQSINALTAKQAILSGSATNMAQALGQTKEQSKELLDWIQKLAIESPFYQEDVAQAFRMAMALGFNTKEAQRLTTAMVDFTVATGQGGETVDRISRALGQMRTKGKVSMEEINQLTEAGVDVMRILQQATGKTGAALSKDITAGAVDVNMAIDAILTDTERLYSGAAKASATSMAGVLSTLDEARGIIGRELFSGMFEQLQGPLGALTTIVTAPEFKAGLKGWSDALGAFTGDQIEAAAGAMERINSAIQPLLAKDAPLWLTALQTVMAAGDQTLGITISPTVTQIKTPDGGLTVEVTPTATTVTSKDGGLLRVDVLAGRITVDANTKDDIPPVILTSKWEEGTLGSLIVAAQDAANAKKILLSVGWAEPIADALARGFQNTETMNAPQKLAESLTSDAAKNALQTNMKAWQLKVPAAIEWSQEQLTTAGTGMFAAVQAAFGTPVAVDGEWKSSVDTKLFTDIQTYFIKPIMLGGAWIESTFGKMWSDISTFFADKTIPIRAAVGGVIDSVTPAPPSGTQLAPVPGFGVMPVPQSKYYGAPFNAAGTDFWKGGWTWVGEEGPELLNLPRGARILSNPDSMRMIGQNAGGTTQLPPGAGPIISLLGSLGLWVPQRQQQMGPKTQDQARGWQDFTQKGVQAMQTAADRTGAAFEETAKKVNQTFESALSSAPGLFGTSQVTAQDMELSKYGLYKPKADEWLRQLGDEVFNGVDRENVDIKDAAKRVGIDPNLPKELIYQVVKQAWDDSSLFADSQNLDLINTDAVKASLEQQQKEMQGQANLKALFGINDENLQKQSEALGQGLASVFGGASETDAVKGAGTALFAKTMAGFTDPGVAAAGVKGMADSIVTATGTPENQAALYDAGGAGYDTYFNGWKAKANAAPIVPPGGGSGSDGTTTPPAGNALGTPSWRGGWTVAGEYGPELLNLPGGTAIYDAPTTQRARRGGMRPMVVNQTFVVNDKLMAEQAAQRAVQLIKRGGR